MNALKQLHLQNCEMVDLVQQEKWWRISSNLLVKRKDMTLDHKANTLSWLIRNAKKLIDHDVDSAYGSGAPDEVISEAEVQARWRLRDPALWMLNQPFCRALLSDLCELAYPTPVDSAGSYAKQAAVLLEREIAMTMTGHEEFVPSPGSAGPYVNRDSLGLFR